MKLLTITTVGYGYTWEWEVFCGSLILQTDERWFCQLINDGPDPMARAICQRYVKEFPDNFSYQETPKRFNDYGHSLRAIGLAEAETPYWCTQNADNYLVPRFVELTMEAMQTRGWDFCIFPCVHNYENVNGGGEPPYTVLKVQPRTHRCDAGSMVLLTELAQQVGWNHRHETADGSFITEVMLKHPKVGRLDNVLMVHN